MACDAKLIRECFAWHAVPHLDDPVYRKRDDGSEDPFSVRAHCPAHDDSIRSFSLSAGDKQLMYKCFAGCNPVRLRAALISAGVPEQCLPLPRKERADLLDRLRAILTAPDLDHAAKALRAMAALEGYEDLPRGSELDRIAGLAGVGRASAYRARKVPLRTSTANTSSYPSDGKPVKRRRSEAS